jgi:DNA-binding NtrC family response regulator
LENVLERAVILTTGATLDIAPDLLPTPAAAPAEEGTRALAAAQPTQDPAQPTLEAMERDYVLTVPQHTN